VIQPGARPIKVTMPTPIKVKSAETFGIWSSEGIICYPVARILIAPLHKLGVTPNMITVSNIFFSAYGAYLLANGSAMITVLAMIYVHQLMDAMDGTMARKYGMTSSFGAKLDEFTDVSYGIGLTVCHLMAVWPNLYAVATALGLSVFWLAAAMAYSQSKEDKTRKIQFLEDLTFLEKAGLWGVESMSINMLFSVSLVYASRIYNDSQGLEHGTWSLWLISLMMVGMGMIAVLLATDAAEKLFPGLAKIGQ